MDKSKKGVSCKISDLVRKINSYLYQSIPKICPTIKKKAKERGIKLMTGTCKTVKAIIEHLCDLKEME